MSNPFAHILSMLEDQDTEVSDKTASATETPVAALAPVAVTEGGDTFPVRAKTAGEAFFEGFMERVKSHTKVAQIAAPSLDEQVEELHKIATEAHYQGQLSAGNVLRSRNLPHTL